VKQVPASLQTISSTAFAPIHPSIIILIKLSELINSQLYSPFLSPRRDRFQTAVRRAHCQMCNPTSDPAVNKINQNQKQIHPDFSDTDRYKRLEDSFCLCGIFGHGKCAYVHRDCRITGHLQVTQTLHSANLNKGDK
jgi:hypothetical protein